MRKGLVGVVLASVLVGHWLGQVRNPVFAQDRGARPIVTWPPKPTDIVNLDGEFKISKGKAFTIFEVPGNQVLVVTDFSVIGGTGSTWKAPSLVERIGKSRTIKRGYRHALFTHFDGTDPGRQFPSAVPQQYHSAVGLVFAPGSKVQLVTETGGTRWCYNLTGYLTTAR